MSTRINPPTFIWQGFFESKSLEACSRAAYFILDLYSSDMRGLQVDKYGKCCLQLDGRVVHLQCVSDLMISSHI